MPITREELFRELYYRENGKGRKLSKCRQCSYGPVSVRADVISSEPCDKCEAVDWRDLTEEEFLSESDLTVYLTLLSEHLASEMGNLYDADIESDEWRKVLKTLVEGFEGFGNAKTASWLQANLGKEPKMKEYILDEFYVRNFLKNAQKMVDRTMKLTAMVPRATPSREVNIFLREATRCWVEGHFQSSVALSRTALEIALKDNLRNGQGLLPSDDKFKTAISYAYTNGVIDRACHEMAEDVRKKANDVVHGAPANEDLATQVLTNTRGVLGHIYSL